MKSQLNKFEAISICGIIMVSQIILCFPEYIIDLTGSGSIVNILFLSLITIIFCFIISKILKNFANNDIIDISEFVGGKFLKFIFSIIMITFLLLSAILAISNFSYVLKNIYFSTSAALLILAFFIVPIIVANFKGIYSLKKIICLFFPLLAISILLLFFRTTSDFNLNNFFPILGYNASTTFKLGLQNIFSLNFILLYLFIMPNLKKKNDFNKILWISFFLNIILLLVSLSAILLYFPSGLNRSLNDFNSLNNIYLITRRIQISTFIQQTDALFVFLWSFSILCYISFLVYGITYILNKLFNFQNKSFTTFPIISIILGFCLIINKINIIKFLESYVFKYFSIVLIFGICFILLLIAYLKYKYRLKKSQKGL